MRIDGERFKRTSLIQTNNLVVTVEVEMAIPVDDPSEPCYESEAVEFLREVKEGANREEIQWFMEHGKVYAAVGA